MLKKTRLPFRIGSLMAVLILFALFAGSASALTYTKNSFPTSSGNVITCDGDDFRISCQDSGDGKNHFCSTFGTNGCRAVEGRANYGSPGCLITCQREDRCSDGTSPGQCSATNPFYCDAGILVKRASLCGCVSPNIRSGEDCIQPSQVQQAQTCSDNTPFNQCSSNRPLFCLGGSLVNRALTCGCPSGQTASGDNCITIQAQQQCTDGTFFGQCSPTRPLFCNNGVLINRATSCGCPGNQVASGDNCVTQAQQTCSDGTSSGQCSPNNPPLFCENGNLVNRASSCACPGNQVVSGDNCIPSTQVTSTTGNKLVITDIDAKVDGRASSNIKDNGEISREAKPGSDIELKIKIKNTFTSAEDIDIEDIQVKAAIEGIEDSNDIEEESESFDLRAGADKTVRFKFKVPLNVDEGTYNIFIEADGEDENGISHNDDADVDLEVEKDLHDLRFASLDLSPREISCSRDLNANARIISLGEEDDESAMLEIRNDDLGLNIRSPVSIKSDTDNNAAAKNIRFSIGSSAREGTYSIRANAISEDGTVRDSRSTDVTITACGAEPQDDGVFLQISTPPKTKGREIIAPLFDFNLGSLDPKMPILLLAIFIIILFVLIIIFAAASEKPSDEEQYY